MSVAIAILACIAAVGFYIEMKIRTNRAQAEVKRMQGLIDSPMLVRNTPVGIEPVVIEQRYPYYDVECHCVRLGPGGSFIDLKDYVRIIAYLHKTYKSDKWELLVHLVQDNSERGMTMMELNDLIRTIYGDVFKAPDYGTPDPVEDKE